MPTVIVPVGFPLGPEHSLEGPPDRTPEHWDVHFPDPAGELSLEEFAAWGAAYLAPERHAGLEVTRDSLEKLLREYDKGESNSIGELLREYNDGHVTALGDPTATISRLLERGLLLEFDPLEDALDELFRGFKLYPQGHGLGSTPEDPDTYRIGYAGQPLAQVSRNVYQLWSYSFTLATLWHACSYLAGATGALHRSDPLYDRGEALARELGCAIPLLVSTGCAFLHPVTLATRE